MSLDAEAKAHFDYMLADATPEHRRKLEEALANVNPATASLLNADADLTPRVMTNIHSKRPENFTPDERSEAEWLIKEVTLFSTCFDDWIEDHAAFRNAVTAPPRTDLFPHALTPLFAEFDTKARRMHDGVHQIVLQGWPELSKCQFELDDALRRKREFEMQIEIITFLNAISQHLTGKKRIFMLDEYTSSMDQQMAQLADLRARKPTLHKVVMQKLIQASLFQCSPHSKGCSCPLCSHMMSCLAASAGMAASERSFV